MRNRLPWEIRAVLVLIVLDGIAVIATYSPASAGSLPGKIATTLRAGARCTVSRERMSGTIWNHVPFSPAGRNPYLANCAAT